MENSNPTLQALFNNAFFRIPQYQRSYAWDDDPHLICFIDDLRQQISAQKKDSSKQYFLGTLLLHEVKEGTPAELHIVDGQQRLTTAVIFIATAIQLYKAKKIVLDDKKAIAIERSFIQDKELDIQKFHTIEEDDPFFRNGILSIGEPANNVDSPSSRRMSAAKEFFKKSVQLEDWQDLLDILVNSRVMIYSVTSPADATQIFELQNDRGKRLTDLEALKSYLMHTIYLNAKNPDDKLRNIQTQFAKIFRSIEDLSQMKRTPGEDALLSYHCAAFLDWKEDEWRTPKKLIKRLIRQEGAEKIVLWIETFVNDLQQSFADVVSVSKERDTRHSFTDLIILGRLAPFWPLLLKTWRADSGDRQHFNKICRLLEIYSFRGYGISNLRSDCGLPNLYNTAKSFSGNFEKLYNHLTAMCKWNDVETRFLIGLDSNNLYKRSKNDALYLLWKYENHLRQLRGQIQPLLSWREFVEPQSYAAKLSVEHIAAQDNPIANTVVVWDKEKEVKKETTFAEVALHRLGNMVIDSISPNAAKGKMDLTGKLKHLQEKSTYLSQGELLTFVENFKIDSEPQWDIAAVKKRHTALSEFAIKNWDPSTYHITTSQEEEPETDIPSEN